MDEGKHCNIHINMAGCMGSNDYFTQAGTGLIDYAATNDIILLNPWVKNCFDFRSSTGKDYATKDGIQPKAIMKMV